MKIFFWVLLLLPHLVQAEMYQCEEHSHTVYQSWPCDAVLHRPPAPALAPALAPAPLPAPDRLAMDAQTQNQQDTSAAQQNKQPRMSEEERLFYKHKSAVADTSQNSAIQALRELFK